MTTLEREVRRVRRRLLLQAFSRHLAWCWFAALLLAAAAIAVGKYRAPMSQQAWATAWLVSAAVGGLLAAAAWSYVRRGSATAAAIELDRRLGLKERVSSTLALSEAEQQSPVGQALISDANHRLRHASVAEAFQLRPDRKALLPIVAASLAFLLAAFVPVRVSQSEAKASIAAKKQSKQATQSLAKKLSERRKQTVAKGLREAESIAKLEAGVNELARSEPKDRKQTLVELNDLVKEAQQRRDKLSGTEDLKKHLAGLKDLKQGPAEKLGKAVKHGDFDKALEEIKKLREELAGEKLSPEAQQALAEQMRGLEQALKQKAEAHERLVQELNEQMKAQREAGNEAQAQKLQEQLDKLAAQKPQMEQLAQMAQQLEQAAGAMENGDCQQAGECLNQLGDQLAGMQENLQEMQALDMALEEVADCKRAMACKECNGQGCGACQGGDDWTKRFGELDPRMVQRGGGQGIGVGVGPGIGPETDPEGNFYDSDVKQQPGRGGAKVVGEADGPNRKGQVREEIQTEFSAAEQNGEDALSEQRLPHDYRDHAKTYFDALRDGKP
ncbi:MAG: hypothetical protein DWQ37_06095 [Planctomycetota bacterium]|nr:MAG: hypothetical protein DWQ37_06095 [Planctomycetota bacterium]